MCKKKTAKGVSSELSVSLEPYVKDSIDYDRNENLLELCRSAVLIRRKIRSHPSEWTFGSWSNVDALFPSVMNNGMVVIDAQLD